MATDKTVIFITGANSGIGYETVLALAKASPNFHVVLGARNLEKGQKALAEIEAQLASTSDKSSTVSVVQIDVTDHASIKAAAAHVEAEFGKLDVLISNAGVIITKPCDTITNLRETFETNVFGAVLVTEAFQPLLKKSKKPYLVYVSSSQGSITLKLDPTHEYSKTRGEYYRMSKAAMNMLSACHRDYFAEWGCRVCAFNPGFCVTNLTGEKGRQMRIDMGGRPATDPANALVEVVLGQRDADFDKSGIMDLDGGLLPW